MGAPHQQQDIQESVAQHAIKLYRGRGAGASVGHRWVRENCQMLTGLLRQKNAAIRKLSLAAVAAQNDPTLSQSERLYQVRTLEVFERELNESEHSVFQAALGLQRVLHGDYRDVVSMKHSSRLRLEALREAAIKVREPRLIATVMTIAVYNPNTYNGPPAKMFGITSENVIFFHYICSI